MMYVCYGNLVITEEYITVMSLENEGGGAGAGVGRTGAVSLWR